MTNNWRNNTRFQVKDGSRVDVQVSDPINGDHSGSLLDISTGGLRMHVSKNLSPGSDIVLSIASEGGCSLDCEAAVCSTEPGIHGLVLRCAFYEDLEHAHLAGLATRGVIERRIEDRRPIDRNAVARTELDLEEFKVGLMDASQGGFCIRSESFDVKLNDRLKLVSIGESAANIRSRVAWKKEFDDQMILGCSFLTKDDYDSMLAHTTQRKRLPLQVLTDPTSWPMVAASVLLVIFAYAFLL
jgi:hypothetical protein